MERIRDHVSALCSGWPTDKVSQIVLDSMSQTICPHVYAEARTLLASHQRDGHDVVIVSTSGQEIVEPIGAMLGVSRIIATRLEVFDGRYTGKVDFYAYGQAKADRVSELAKQRGYQLTDCYAYSDSVTDLPMLELVGHPRVVNPDRALRKIARARDWPELSFRLTGVTEAPAI